MSSKPVRTLITIIMDLLVVVAIVLTVRLCVVFFGQLAAQGWGQTVIALTNPLIIPFGVAAIKTPYGGSLRSHDGAHHRSGPPCGVGALRRSRPGIDSLQASVRRTEQGGRVEYSREKMGELLVRIGLITEEQLDVASPSRPSPAASWARCLRAIWS